MKRIVQRKKTSQAAKTAERSHQQPALTEKSTTAWTDGSEGKNNCVSWRLQEVLGWREGKIIDYKQMQETWQRRLHTIRNGF